MSAEAPAPTVIEGGSYIPLHQMKAEGHAWAADLMVEAVEVRVARLFDRADELGVDLARPERAPIAVWADHARTSEGADWLNLSSAVGSPASWEEAGFTGAARAMQRDAGWVHHAQAIDLTDRRQTLAMFRGVTRTLQSVSGILRHLPPDWYSLKLRIEDAGDYQNVVTPWVLSGWVRPELEP